MTESNLVKRLARSELIDMEPYQSARRLHSAAGGDFNNKVWLNANEAAGKGNYQVDSKNINRYPDFQPENLLSAYSRYVDLPQKNILATRGADEGIELIIRTFCQSYQDSILICPPTYGMYAISAENHGANIIKVPLIDNDLDMDGLAKQVTQVKVVFLCSPGNPTGNLLPFEQIKSTLDLYKNSAIVVVDEAYIEFSADNSLVSLLAQYENLVILRTLSKAFALAGLRCGFTLASNDIIEMLSKVIAPYPVAAPIAEIASKAINIEGIEIMTSRVKQTKQLRQTLVTWLEEQTWCDEVFTSDANFVLFRTQIKDEIFSILLEHDILIRDQSKQVQLENCLRISIGSEEELNLLRKTLSTKLA